MPETMSPREKVELKPCPFCGGEAEVIHLEDGDNAGGSCVCCTKCQASGNVEFGFKENFVSNWNRRTTLASGSGDHAELASECVRGLQSIEGRICESDPFRFTEGTIYAKSILGLEALIAENAALRARDAERYAVLKTAVAYRDRATEAERKLAEAVATLKEIAEIEPQPFDGGLDMEAIRTCDECQRYAGHPVQRGICNTHRRPIWDREKHESREEKSLGYRAKSIARTFLSKEAERG